MKNQLCGVVPHNRQFCYCHGFLKVNDYPHSGPISNHKLGSSWQQQERGNVHPPAQLHKDFPYIMDIFS